MLGETCRKAVLQAPRPRSQEELAAIAKLVELHEITEAKSAAFFVPLKNLGN